MVRLTRYLIIGLAFLPVNKAHGEWLRQAKFQWLHQIDDGVVQEVGAHPLLNFQIIGEKIVLENGNLSVAVQKVLADGMQAEGLQTRATVKLDTEFFQNPIKAVASSFLKNSMTLVSRMQLKATLVDRYIEDTQLVDVVLKDVKLPLKDNTFSMSSRCLAMNLDASGTTAYQDQAKKLVFTVADVKLAGLPVPLDVAFFVMSHFLHYDFIVMQKPNLIVDLKPFLPAP